MELPKPATEDLEYGLDTEQIEAGGEMAGGAVNILTGNLVEVRRDLDFPSANRLGFRFEAFYNSRWDSASSGTPVGALGYGWRHTYEAMLIGEAFTAGATVKVVEATGRAHYFRRESGGTYTSLYNEHTTLSALSATAWASWVGPSQLSE